MSRTPGQAARAEAFRRGAAISRHRDGKDWDAIAQVAIDCWVRECARMAGVSVVEPEPPAAEDDDDEPEVDETQPVY